MYILELNKHIKDVEILIERALERKRECDKLLVELNNRLQTLIDEKMEF